MTQGKPTAAPAYWPYRDHGPFRWQGRPCPQPQRVMKGWWPKAESCEQAKPDAVARRAYDRARYDRERRSARG